MLRTAAACLFLLATALAGPGAYATEVLLDSDSPYWEVGPRDKDLSRACSLGRFNERQPGRYTLRLHARNGGAAVLGVATGSGFNLYDPDHMARPTEDYYFRDDDTSSCEVFVGGRMVTPQKPAQ
jgi:hypothetical protein